MPSHIFPTVLIDEHGDPVFTEGGLFKSHNICTIKRKKCKEFYSNTSLPGFAQCPYGFSTYLVIDDYGNKIFIISIKVKGFYNKNLTKKRKSGFSPEIKQDIFWAYTSGWTNDDYTNIKISSSSAQDVGLQTNAIHEIRKINRELKFKAEKLKQDLEHTNYITQSNRNDISDLFWLSSLTSTRLNFFDYEVNPNSPLNPKRNISVYKKFDKIRYCLNSLFGKRDIYINLSQCYLEIMAYDVFELLPFILFENCFKYSPPGSSVDVCFTEFGDKLVIEIASLGPELLDEEKNKVFDFSFRGENSKAFADGTGTGLYFATSLSG